MVIDIVLLIFAGYGFYLGFSRGIIKTVFTVLSYVFGLMAAFKFTPPMTKFLENTIDDNPLMFVAGFLLSFVLTIILIRMLARGIEGLLETANINFINQAAGGVLLAVVMILVYSMVLWFGDRSHILDESTKEESMTYSYLETFPEQVWHVGKILRPTFEEFWDASVDFMDRLEQNADRSEPNTRIFDIEDDEGR